MPKGNFAGIILAAGKSERFGSPKILVDWQGDPLVRYVTQKVISFDLGPVIVIVGAFYDEVSRLLEDLPVSVVRNEQYEAGIGTSLSKGIQSIQGKVEGAFLFLCDHPFIPAPLVTKMREISCQGDVILPVYQAEIGHPVLWMSQTFPRIRRMTNGETGNSIRREFINYEIPWGTNEIISDIDTPEDYSEFSHLAG